MLSPTSSGTVALQLAVPAALPEPPVELLHATYATPTLSTAVPLTRIELVYAAMVVAPGETMVSDGGV